MSIKDPDVRRALETLTDEFENLEASVSDKDDEIKDLEEECQRLQGVVDELEKKVQELEDALAEAYLTSEDYDGRDPGATEAIDIQGGRSPDVPDTADDKTSN